MTDDQFQMTIPNTQLNESNNKLSLLLLWLLSTARNISGLASLVLLCVIDGMKMNDTCFVVQHGPNFSVYKLIAFKNTSSIDQHQVFPKKFDFD
ncbi:hypothetical protein BLOT_013199 [Blomia tropicalis]|nr:hypothetical protein BLOT_013199 [Blomia tropicalis]